MFDQPGPGLHNILHSRGLLHPHVRHAHYVLPDIQGGEGECRQAHFRRLSQKRRRGQRQLRDGGPEAAEGGGGMRELFSPFEKRSQKHLHFQKGAEGGGHSRDRRGGFCRVLAALLFTHHRTAVHLRSAVQLRAFVGGEDAVVVGLRQFAYQPLHICVFQQGPQDHLPQPHSLPLSEHQPEALRGQHARGVETGGEA